MSSRLVGRQAVALIGIASVVGIIVAKVSAGCVRNATPPNYSLISTSAPPAPSPIPLAPNDQGYVRIETKSGSTGCSINRELVACQTSSDNWRSDGRLYHTASVSSGGEFHWVDADLGELQGHVTLDYQTYSAQGWTIVATSGGTKFTNDHSGHGMSVSDQKVTPL